MAAAARQCRAVLNCSRVIFYHHAGQQKNVDTMGGYRRGDTLERAIYGVEMAGKTPVTHSVRAGADAGANAGMGDHPRGPATQELRAERAKLAALIDTMDELSARHADAPAITDGLTVHRRRAVKELDHVDVRAVCPHLPCQRGCREKLANTAGRWVGQHDRWYLHTSVAAAGRGRGTRSRRGRDGGDGPVAHHAFSRRRDGSRGGREQRGHAYSRARRNASARPQRPRRRRGCVVSRLCTGDSRRYCPCP